MEQTKYELRGEYEELKSKLDKIKILKRVHLRTLSKLTCNQFQNVDTDEIKVMCDEIDKVNKEIKQIEPRFNELKSFLGLK